MLDCRSLAHQLLPIPADIRLVVCNSMVKHELAVGEYNRRRADCEIGVNLLQEHLPEIMPCVTLISRISRTTGKCYLRTIYRRCRHV